MTFVERFIRAKSRTYDIEYERRISFIKDNFLENFSSGRILDLGCYKGTLSNLIPGAEYYGLDKFDFYKGKGKFVKHDLDNGEIPFYSGFFYVVVCTDVLEHLAFPDKILLEIDRVMMNNGIAIISLPNESGLKGFVERHFITPRSWDDEKDFRHLWYFNINIAQDFVSRVFNIISDKPYSGRILGNIPILGNSRRLCSSWFMVCKKK